MDFEKYLKRNFFLPEVDCSPGQQENNFWQFRRNGALLLKGSIVMLGAAPLPLNYFSFFVCEALFGFLLNTLFPF